MIKACFFDIGNTLVCKSKGLGMPPSLQNDLRSLQKRGIKLGVCSIRNMGMAKAALGDFEFDYYVLFDGAVIYKRETKISERPISAVLNDNWIAAYADSGIHAKNEEIQKSLLKKGFVTTDCSRPEGNIYALVYETGASPKQYHVVRWQKSGVDVCLRKGVSKSSAIELICNKEGWSKEEVAVFGDGPNDFEMIQSFPNSVAMAGCPAEVGYAAKFVTAASFENGVSNALSILNLLPPVYLLYIESSLDDIGGMETHAKYLKKFLWDKGDVYVVSHRNGENTIVESNMGCSTKYADLKTVIGHRDIRVFFNSGHWIEEMDEIKSFFPKARVLYRTGGNEIPSAPLLDLTKPLENRQRYWIETLNRNVDILITNSRFTEKRLEELGIRGSMLRLCRGGVPLSSIESLDKKAIKKKLFKEQRIHLVCSARFEPYKRMWLLLAAFDLLPKQYDLTIIGDGPDFSELKLKYEKNERIYFLGKKEHEKVLPYIVGADIYLQCSGNLEYEVPGGRYIHCEGMGRTILEAIASRTYIVSTDSGALSEIINGKRGVICGDSPSEIAAAVLAAPLEELPRDEEVDGYDFEAIFQKYLRFWERQRVALITSKFYGVPDGGGSSMVSSIVKAANGYYDLDFYCLRSPRSDYGDFNAFRHHVFLPNPCREGKFSRRLDSIAHYEERINGLLENYDEIVVVHTSKAFGLNDANLAKAIVFPMFNGCDYLRSGEFPPKEYFAAERRVYQNVMAIVVPNEEDKEVITKHYGANPNRIKVISRGISQIFDSKPKERETGGRRVRIVMISSTKLQKNLPEAKEIVALLRKRGYDATLSIYGTIDEKTIYESMIEDAGDFIFFKGSVGQLQLKAALDQSDFFLCTSLQETFGRCVYEAALSRLPCVVSSRLNRVQDTFEDSMAFYSNVEEAANLIEMLNRDVQRTNALTERAYAIASLYSYDKEQEKLLFTMDRHPGLFVLGTRPEAIKMLPILESLQQREAPFYVLDTHQHDGLPTKILMKRGIDTHCFVKLRQGDFDKISEKWAEDTMRVLSFAPSYICVQGDTSSALSGAKLSLLLGVPLYYVEAGLRSFDESNPFPEEIIRKRISKEAALNFAPSSKEEENLIREGARGVIVTGNTFVDYLRQNVVSESRQGVLITIHRKENLPFLTNIFSEIRECCQLNPRVQFLFPVHPNPVIVAAAQKLKNIPNLTLTNPLEPQEFQRKLSSSIAVITDSGGVEEEALFLGIPALIVREKTERAGKCMFPPSGKGMAKLLNELLKSGTIQPDDRYGKGGAGAKIASVILEHVYGKN
ncbi:MAG: UDP-N-acetylglucosamine 2-epimerase [Mollicutes bacterium]|nr:UDP-N-acetylglucosamine 2-epimerase [Mollicutes bacterium]